MKAVLSKAMKDVFAASRRAGWVLEPRAKELLAAAGLAVPRFTWAHDMEEATQFARVIGYPVVAKVVSPDIIHKSEAGGVSIGIKGDDELRAAYERFRALKGFAGMLVEEMVDGVELIVGAKVDYQFGPVILVGIGGTSVEIYKDTRIRIAPLAPTDVDAMVHGLRAHQLLEGYRGTAPINMQALTAMLMAFSGLVMDCEALIESIDLNPVACASDRCIVADARIMLAGAGSA
jgi:acetate---CoA ligase (ADP-forming) subunit beta